MSRGGNYRIGEGGEAGECAAVDLDGAGWMMIMMRHGRERFGADIMIEEATAATIVLVSTSGIVVVAAVGGWGLDLRFGFDGHHGGRTTDRLVSQLSRQLFSRQLFTTRGGDKSRKADMRDANAAVFDRSI